MTDKFKVTRQVQFDKPYVDGDIYEGNAGEVAHLVANGVLVPLKARAAPAVKNKVEPKHPNKAG